jgi:hypothetical protein
VDRFLVPAINYISSQRYSPLWRQKIGGTSVHESRTFGLVVGLGVGAGIFYYKSLVDVAKDVEDLAANVPLWQQT